MNDTPNTSNKRRFFLVIVLSLWVLMIFCRRFKFTAEVRWAAQKKKESWKWDDETINAKRIERVNAGDVFFETLESGEVFSRKNKKKTLKSKSWFEFCREVLKIWIWNFENDKK